MGRLSFFDDDGPEKPQEGSTIPRVIRLGPNPSSPAQAAPVQPTNTREEHRFVPHRSKTFLTVSSGKKLDARIINMSASAVAVEANLSAISPTDVTMVGSHRVRPGRKIALGAVFLFVKPIPAEQCNESLMI